MGTAKKGIDKNTDKNTQSAPTEKIVLKANVQDLFKQAIAKQRTKFETSGAIDTTQDEFIVTDAILESELETAGNNGNSYLQDIIISVVSYQAEKVVQKTVIPATWNDTGLNFTIKAGTPIYKAATAFAKFVRNAQKKEVKESGATFNLARVESQLLTETDKDKRAHLKRLQKALTRNFGALSVSIEGSIYLANYVHKGNAINAPERLFRMLSLTLGKSEVEQTKFDEQFYTVAPIEADTESTPETIPAESAK